MRRIVRFLSVALLCALVMGCSDPDTQAAELYDKMTEIVTRYSEAENFDKKAFREELGPLEAEMLEIESDDSASVAFSRRGAAAKRYYEALDELLHSPAVEEAK